MDSSDVMFGIILLGFVLSGMTARAEYLGLRRGRKPSEKSRPLAVAPPCLSPGLEHTRSHKASIGAWPPTTQSQRQSGTAYSPPFK